VRTNACSVLNLRLAKTCTCLLARESSRRLEAEARQTSRICSNGTRFREELIAIDENEEENGTRERVRRISDKFAPYPRLSHLATTR